MTSRSPVLRSAFFAVLATAAISCVGLVAPVVAAPPGATTASGANYAGTKASTLAGSVYTTDGTAVTYHFEYGTTTAYGTSTPSKTVQPPANQNANVEETVATTPSTTYHFRIVAVSAGGERAVGGDSTFTTPAAPSPIARTGSADEIGETSARLGGYGGSTDPSDLTFRYVFQYGKTTAYGNSTPVASGASPAQYQSQEVHQKLSGLASSTVYHYRIVVQDSNGTTAIGEDTEFETRLGPPPYVKPPNSTTTSDTVGPGGSVSTGSDPSGSDPIEMKVSLEKGGKVYLDKIKNPDRPGADPEAEHNPEDPSANSRDFYGPAVQFQVVADVTQMVTVTYTIHGGADQTDGYFRNRLSQESFESRMNPLLDGGCARWGFGKGRSFRNQRVHYLSNGDLQLKLLFQCVRFHGPTAAHFYNRSWGVLGSGEWSGPGYDESLNRVLGQGYLDTSISCLLKCSRSSKATISPATAKALGLKSNVLATDHSGPGATLKDEWIPARNGTELHLRMSKKVRRALKRVNQITVTFRMKAVGPDGQVWKKTAKLKFKKDEDDSDSIN